MESPSILSVDSPLTPDWWRNSRHIVHLIGVNGSGKSTLGRRLAQRCASHGGKAILDSEQRAYDPDFERANAGRSDFHALHRETADRAIALLNDWARSDANLVVVDRWHESYDFALPANLLDEIDSAIASSGFRLRLVQLLVGGDSFSLADDFLAMSARVAHTKAHRPASWWATGRGSFEDRVREECDCQAAYGQFFERSPFPKIRVFTTEMNWADCERRILGALAET